jgi:hypothetical protein
LNGIVFIFEISLPKDILRQTFYLFGLVPARYPGKTLLLRSLLMITCPS